MWNWREEWYRFEDFVIGDANETAYHIARQFVSPSYDFHLFVVIGNAGSGKTHLAKAVEMELLVQNKSVKMMNSDQFVGDLIWYLGRNVENKGMKVFLREYEKVDVLILDDIQFLEGKEITQKYFAYLLAHMVMKQKRVLITSVKEISEYQWLQDAFHKNAVQMKQVHIQDADVELKKKILNKLQKEWNYELSQESADLIVENAKDIRHLEGMFKKMMAYVQLMGVENIG